MKNALILSLLFVIALLVLGNRDRGEVQAMIEDTTKGDLSRAGLDSSLGWRNPGLTKEQPAPPRVSIHAAATAFPPSTNATANPTKTDFPLCITIRPSPLLRTPNGRVGFRQGVRSNDKGWS